jgi:hypothetical protein
VSVPGRQGRSRRFLAGGCYGLQDGERVQERGGGGAGEHGEAGQGGGRPAGGVVAVAPVVPAGADLA